MRVDEHEMGHKTSLGCRVGLTSHTFGRDPSMWELLQAVAWNHPTNADAGNLGAVE